MHITVKQDEGWAVPPGHYATIDLFAGTGAFSAGLRAAGHAGSAILVDNASDCARTLHANNPDALVLQADVERLEWRGVSAQVVVGGPPCQGFSTLGRRDPDDPRNEAYRGLLRCVEQVRPELVALENVPAFLRSQQAKKLLLA